MPDFGSMPAFKISTPCCPKCGTFPRGLQVTIEGSAHMYTDDNGKTFEYNGHVQHGGAYKPRVDGKGRSSLICGGGHRWTAVITFIHSDSA